MGELLRRYWHPVAASVELAKEPTKAVRVLGEDLVLYRGRSGALGLIGQACAHRRVNLLYGIPEEKGLRCPYHGWLYNERGQCVEQPAEAPDSTFKDRVRIPAYPVRDFAGLIWAYLGPEPAPLLPRWDLFVMDGVFRQVGITLIPCNWLQCMENSIDQVHLEWLHGHYFQYVLERQGLGAGQVLGYMGAMAARPDLRRHKKIGWDVFKHGIIKRRVWEDTDEEHEDWKVGHPLIFPNILRIGGSGLSQFHIRVPMDDTHTLDFRYECFDPGLGVVVPKQQTLPAYQVPVYGDDGRHAVDFVDGQDVMTWVVQGEIADRTQEHLAESDRGIILYRRILREQMEQVAEGADPMNVFRDPAENDSLELPQERRVRAGPYRRGSHTIGMTARYSPAIEEIEELFVRAAAAREAAASEAGAAASRPQSA
jgi:5,5'-dehydrodivanillate O-demethylase